jgi:5-methylthioribose kinase
MDRELRNFLVEFGFASSTDAIVATTLGGGVSCDVWRIDAGGRSVCVKRALPRLRVDALWEAPVTRNTNEWRWMQFAARIVPGSVPRPLAHDPARNLVAMEYLESADYPVWKQLLLRGEAHAPTARAVASVLARLHAASANNREIKSLFDTEAAFHALRIEPYLLEAGRRNPQVGGILGDLAEQAMNTRLALVHGDVSPKNILVGRAGPVLLDAETAWYGDPAFDLAFCLNHLLLKCVACPFFTANYLDCFRSFASEYLSSVSWEPATGLEQRTAHLLPALLLARVDGKSPVEYLDGDDRSFVRRKACKWLREPPQSLDALVASWRKSLSAWKSH